MALCKRLIARLDIKGSRLIKGIRFEGLRVLGDPCEAALNYTQAGADELLYVDAVASLYGRNSLVDLLRRTSREVFIPITAGGGVRSVADAAALLAAGADKIAVNTAALHRPELITELSQAFGSQCVVASIQARRTGAGSWEAMAESGRERSGRDVLAWIEYLQQLGAGEILLTSVDQDGTCAGPDQVLQSAASAIVRIPLVLCGGFANSNQVLAALQIAAVTAVCIGSALHQGRLELHSLKRMLASAQDNLPLRLQVASVSDSPQFPPLYSLVGFRIGIINYGMGNQQSLMNALECIGAIVVLSAEPDLLQDCDLIALPGVGAYPKGMAELQKRGLDRFIIHWAAQGKPLLGICLGMQMLFEGGEEFVATAGLGLLQGYAIRLPSMDANGKSLILPHVGWNRLLPGPACQLDSQAGMISQYFVHSYAVSGVNHHNVLYSCRYGHHPFVAAVQRDRVVGFQFHPERSGPDGLALLAATCRELLNL